MSTPPNTPIEELVICKEGARLQSITQCPNMKALPCLFCDDYERYKCDTCGQTYKIYDDEMK